MANDEAKNIMIRVNKYDINNYIVLLNRQNNSDVALKPTANPIKVLAQNMYLRYHFDINNELLELIVERRAVHVGGPNAPKPTYISSIDRVYTVRKYKIGFEASNHEHQKYVILNPAPKSVSKADGASLMALCNNDDLIPGVKVCGLKWFVETKLSQELYH